MDETQLKRAVLLNPQDDAPRLAYAACCDARGDKAHGDYIRAMVARARVDRHSDEAQRLFQEELRALQARPKEVVWHPEAEAVEARYRAMTGMRHTVFCFEPVRGFIGGVSCRVIDFLAAAEELFALEPIERAGLQWEGGTGEGESADDPERLAKMAALGNVRAMYLPAEVALLRGLKGSAYLGNVERLNLWRRVGETRPLDGEAFVGELVEALGRGFSGVRRLGIAGVKLAPPEVAKLCGCQSAGAWRRLALERAELKDEGARVLAGAGLEQVAELWLCENGITGAGVKMLADAPGLIGVRDLDLGKNVMDEAGMSALMDRKSMPGLARLGVEESVRERVYEDWTDWNGGNVGGGFTMREMSAKAVKAKYPLPGVVIYGMRGGD